MPLFSRLLTIGLIFVAADMAAAASGPTGAAAPFNYQATLLPQMDEDPGDPWIRRTTTPTAINAARRIVGLTGSGTGFVWTPETGGHLLQPQYPLDAARIAPVDVNQHGEIVGEFLPPGEGFLMAGAFHISADGVFTALPPYAPGLAAGATGINDSGLIVGSAETEPGGPLGGPVTSVYWRDGLLTDLGGFGSFLSRAHAVNNHDVITGYANTPEVQFPTPYHWNVEDGMLPLPQLVEGVDSTPHAINDNGIIVGEGVSQWGMQAAATYWDAQGNVFALPGIHPEATYAVARAVNNHGVMVGQELPDLMSDFQARLWFDGAVYDLNDLVLDLPQHFRLRDATDINDQGDIVAYGYFNDQAVDLPDFIAVVLTLAPPDLPDEVFVDRFESP